MPDSPAFHEAGGAYVNCWIDASTREEAEIRARRHIVSESWQIERLEDARIVTRETYSPDDPSLGCFEQACIDSEVLVFHRWPVDPQEGDVVH